ncbi:MAG: metallophosphoesterase family protein [Myxococcales bacterium]|nr:metallophosphoesterase family protein [Myxococcales bacterium]
MAAPASDILIVSDLHLGGPLRPPPHQDPDHPPPIGLRAIRRVVRLDRELARFIDYHRAHPSAPGRRWTLIFNGDTIDFLHMDVRPDQDQLDAEESHYGLAFDERRARFKLAVIARCHRHSLTALARFIEAGHQVVFIVGNHDVDLWFGEVRNDLIEQIAAHADDPEQVRAGVRFEPWFYYDAGRAYVEHGHRFDPYATFPDPLSPLAADRARYLAPNFGHFGLRYFCNRVPSFPIHDLDTMTWRDLWAWVKAHWPWGLLRSLGQYVAFVFRYAQATARDRFSRGRREAVTRARRRDRLRRFAARHGWPLARILALDGMRKPHVGETIGRLIQALHLDRLALIGLTLACVVVALGLVDAPWSGLLALGVAGLGFGAWRQLDRTRPPVDVHPLLGRVARRVGRLTDAKVVVFGHTHRPTLRQVGKVRWLNPGSWEHLPRQHLHADGAPCDCAARFGIIAGDRDHLRTRLVRWCARAHAPLRIEQEA